MMKCLINVYYANNNGGLTFQPYENLKLRKKHVNYVIKKHKIGCNFKEDMKVNYESSLSVAYCFPYGTFNLMILLAEDGKDW